jgi:signal transduction histidine kinase
MRCAMLKVEEDPTLRIIGIMTDITEQENVRAAEREQRILAEALRDTAESLTSTLSLDNVVERISTTVGRVVPHDAALIMLIENGVAQVVRSRADTAHRLYHVQGQQKVTDVPWLSHLVETGEPLIVEHIDDLYLPGVKWAQSFLGIPIYSDEQIIGVLCLYNENTHAFTTTHIEHLKMFAGQAALAIRNAKFFEAERKDRQLAQTLQKTAETLATSTDLETTIDTSGRIFRFIVEHEQFALNLEPENFKRLTAAETVNKQYLHLYECVQFSRFAGALLHTAPVILEDIQADEFWRNFPNLSPEIHAWIGVPLLIRGEMVGIVSFGRKSAKNFSHNEKQVVMAFIQQIALFVENNLILLELEMRLKELHETQSQLVRMTRLSTAGEIAAGVAHQINNPLTTIVAEAYLTLQNLPPEDANHESLQAIEEAARRAGSVVGRLLDLTRTFPYEMYPIDLNTSLQSAIGLMQGQIVPQYAHLEMDLDPNLPLIDGSMQHLEDVWINLLLNARDAMDINRDNIIKIQSLYSSDTNNIYVIIEDTGTGIDEKNLPHIFDSFFTTKIHGTGLGLSICKDIIERHGGSINITSQKHKGTRVTVKFKTG